MASTYSTNLKIELIGTGEQSGTWGNTTNTNLGTLIEEAIAGYVTQAVTDGAATVLTIPNGTSSNGRNYVIQLTGALTANRTVEVPAVDKPYIFFNATTGGFSVTVKVSGQTGVTIANGKKAIVYTNSTDVIEVVNAPVSETGTQTLSNKTLASPTVTGVATFAAGTVSAPALTTTGDTNTGIFFPAADTIAFAEGGAEVLRINSDGQVVTTAGTVSLPALTTTGDTNTGIFFPAADTIAFGEGGAEAMRIDSSGNVGIGTSSPAFRTEIVCSDNNGIQVKNSGGTTFGGMFVEASAMAYGTRSNTAMRFITNDAERMRIDSSGNVGIGTSSPAVKLQVTTSGSAALPPSSGTTPSTGELIRLRTSSDAAGGIGTIGLATNQMWLQACDATNLGAYYTLLLNPNGGNVGIGTGASALTKTLTVQASEPMIQLVDADLTTRVANIGGQNGNVTIDIDPAATAAASQFAVNIDNTERFRIASSGQIGIGGANYGTSGQVLTSNGASAAPSWQSVGGGFAAGTAMLFAQTSAPTGWTKSTTHDNKALRVVSGAASSGGSVAFTTAFASQTPSGSVSVSGTVGSTTLSTAQIPSHSHSGGLTSGSSIPSGQPCTSTDSGNTGSTGGGGSHNHSFSGSGSFSGTAINLAVQYVDVIIATKD